MPPVRFAIAAAALVASAALAQNLPVRSFWTAGFGQGITEYSTGTFDRPADGGLRLSCLPNGGASLSVQIRGVAPAAGSRFLVIPATRRGGSQSFAFTAGPGRDAGIPAARADRRFGRLWAALRGGNNVTIRYADGSFSVQSLVGAAATLPRTVCG